MESSLVSRARSVSPEGEGDGGEGGRREGRRMSDEENPNGSVGGGLVGSDLGTGRWLDCIRELRDDHERAEVRASGVRNDIDRNLDHSYHERIDITDV